jgi:ribosomal protein S18 acetylase RimI-like enzyme
MYACGLTPYGPLEQQRSERQARLRLEEERSETNTNAVRQDGRETAPWAIRPVERADVAALKRLFYQLHRYNAHLDSRFALAEGWEHHVDDLAAGAAAAGPRLALLARHGRRPAGFVLARVHRDAPLWRERDWVEVEALYVEPAWRGAGLADSLLAHALAWAADKGVAVVQLYVTASNARALRFYARHGFHHVQAILRTELSDGSPYLRLPSMPAP